MMLQNAKHEVLAAEHVSAGYRWILIGPGLVVRRRRFSGYLQVVNCVRSVEDRVLLGLI